MRFKEVKETVNDAMDSDEPTMVWGPPGIGKSALMKSLDTTALIDLRLTTLDAIDLRGMPVRVGDKMEFVPLGELPDAPERRGLIFLDEINATDDDDVLKAALGLVLDRKLGKYHVPEGWHIMAAGNRVEDKTGARDLPSALANRFLHIDMEVNLDDWIKWATNEGGMPFELVSFLTFQHDLIYQFDPDARRNPTPRAWEKVGKFVNNPELDGPREQRLITATVGDGPALDFNSFLAIARSLPDINQILVDPKGHKVPTEVAVIFATLGALASRVTRENSAQFMEYANKFSREFTVMAVKMASNRDPSLMETKAMTEWFLNNQDAFSV